MFVWFCEGWEALKVGKPKLQSLVLWETLVCLRFWLEYVHHCLIIQHGVSGGTRLRLPWCTAPLCSAVWEQRAALSAPLVPLGSLPQRQGLALFPFLSFRPLSLFHSLFNTHWALLSTSFAPLSVVRCLKPSLLIRNETLLHLRILALPLAPVFKNVKPLPVSYFFSDSHTRLSFVGHPPNVSSLLPLNSCHFFLLLPHAPVYMVFCMFFTLLIQSLSFPLPST